MLKSTCGLSHKNEYPSQNRNLNEDDCKQKIIEQYSKFLVYEINKGEFKTWRDYLNYLSYMIDSNNHIRIRMNSSSLKERRSDMIVRGDEVFMIDKHENDSFKITKLKDFEDIPSQFKILEHFPIHYFNDPDPYSYFHFKNSFTFQIWDIVSYWNANLVQTKKFNRFLIFKFNIITHHNINYLIIFDDNNVHDTIFGVEEPVGGLWTNEIIEFFQVNYKIYERQIICAKQKQKILRKNNLDYETKEEIFTQSELLVDIIILIANYVKVCECNCHEKVEAIIGCENMLCSFGCIGCSSCEENVCGKCFNLSWCKQHSLLCILCYTSICFECTTVCSCGKNVCNSCTSIRCCGHKGCISCNRICVDCDNVFCSICVLPCAGCMKQICLKCSDFCEQCGKYFCHKNCSVNCSTCEKLICINFCADSCSFCRSLFCEKCLDGENSCCSQCLLSQKKIKTQ